MRKSAMDTSIDWQTTCLKLKHRGAYLLKTGKWADCHFLVGSENNQQLVSGHKLLLAMASPVFDAMFNGTLAEKNDPIPILDVQPEAFVSLLEYIYTDNIEITSMDKACELCYVAKKYMLPLVVQQCTEYLWSDLDAKNVCRAFEFAKLFEEPELAERCLQIICSQTMDVLTHASFEDVDICTIITILDQDYLNIDSELDLFLALARYSEKQNQAVDEENEMIDVDAGEGPSNTASAAPLVSNEMLSFRDALKKVRFLLFTPKQFAENVPRTNLLDTSESFAILMNISCSNVHPMPDGFSVSRKSRTIATTPPAVHGPPNMPAEHAFYGEPHEAAGRFAAGVGRGDLPRIPLQCPTILFNPSGEAASMGSFHVQSSSRAAIERAAAGRAKAHGAAHLVREPFDITETRRFYCIRPIREQIDYFNSGVSDCALTFTVDRVICITGIQVSTQVLGEQSMQSATLPERYSELLYAHLLDSYGTRMTYTHCTSNVRFDSLLEISFDHPVQIEPGRIHKIGVAFNKLGWYPMCTCAPTVTAEGVCFDFRVDGPNGESLRDGLIRSIVFTYPPRSGERD